MFHPRLEWEGAGASQRGGARALIRVPRQLALHQWPTLRWPPHTGAAEKPELCCICIRGRAGLFGSWLHIVPVVPPAPSHPRPPPKCRDHISMTASRHPLSTSGPELRTYPPATPCVPPVERVIAGCLQQAMGTSSMRSLTPNTNSSTTSPHSDQLDRVPIDGLRGAARQRHRALGLQSDPWRLQPRCDQANTDARVARLLSGQRWGTRACSET
jgi:hypothetical protein